MKVQEVIHALQSMGGKRASLPVSNAGVNRCASHGVHGSRAVVEAFSEHCTAVYGWHPWAVVRARRDIWMPSEQDKSVFNSPPDPNLYPPATCDLFALLIVICCCFHDADGPFSYLLLHPSCTCPLSQPHSQDTLCQIAILSLFHN